MFLTQKGRMHRTSIGIPIKIRQSQDHFVFIKSFPKPRKIILIISLSSWDPFQYNQEYAVHMYNVLLEDRMRQNIIYTFYFANFL